MKHFTLYIVITIAIIASSCSNKMAEHLAMGDEAYKADNYELALFNWDKIITTNVSKGKKVSPDLFAKAGLAALQMDDQQKAKDYLTKAYDKGVKSPELLLGLASVYKKSDNLSYELTYLEQLVTEHAQDASINDYKVVLFDTYVRSENWEKASSLWVELSDESKDNLALLSTWLDVQKALKNNDECFNVSKKILEKDPNHLAAQEIMGIYYFNKAESLYQKEMSAYNAKKTRSQYAKLLKSLKSASADFKISRDYFEALYKNSNSKQHAMFLSNIYARLSNKQKSNYYKKRSK